MVDSFKRNILKILLVVLLVFLSLIPRSVEILNKNPIFLLDQGRDYLAVKKIVTESNLTLIGAEIGSGMAQFQGIFHGPFYFYLLSIPFMLFNGNPYGGLLLMFIFGMLSITTGYIFAKKILGDLGGIVMALLVAASPPLISQSRFVWSPHPSTLFILLAFYFIYLIPLKKYKYIFLASFFTGFVYNFEFAIVVPMSVALFLYSLLVFKFRDIKPYIFSLAGFLIAFLPLLIFEFRHGFRALQGVVDYLSSSQVGSFLQIDKLYYNLSWFFYNVLDSFPRQEIVSFVLIFLVSVVALLYFGITEKNSGIKNFLKYLLILIIVTFLTQYSIRTHIFEYYLIHLNLVYIFLFSYIFIVSYQKKEIKLQFILSSFFALFLFYAVLNGYSTFQRDFFDHGGMVKMKGKIEVIDYIYRDAKKEKFGLLVFSPPVYTFPYDYLIWWHGNNTYKYTPHQEKKGLFYLLIEKDFSKPWSYKGWLETVVISGKVLETKELSSGFIVQKRIGD